MPSLDLPAGRIHYLQQGSGPGLVLLHNGFDSSRTWENLLPRLATTHRVTAYDRAGYGGSDPAPFTGDIVAAGAAELVRVLDALGIDRALLAGHCLGAAIALDCAVRYPARVRGVVAEACGFYGDRETVAKCDLVFRPWETLSQKTRQTLIAMHGAERAEAFWRASCSYTDGYVMHPQYDLRPRLARVACPVLVMAGEEDFFFTPEHTRSGAAALPAAQLVLLPGIGHDVHGEVPELWLETLTHFLGKTCRP